MYLCYLYNDLCKCSLNWESVTAGEFFAGCDHKANNIRSLFANFSGMFFVGLFDHLPNYFGLKLTRKHLHASPFDVIY